MESKSRGAIAVSLQASGEYCPICTFPYNESNLKKLKPLNRGDVMTVEGICKGLGGEGDRYVMLDSCILKAISPNGEPDAPPNRDQERTNVSATAPAGSYVQKALIFREECGRPYTQAIPNVPPGSRRDFLHALQLVEFTIDTLKYRHEDGFPAQRALGRLSKKDWIRIFGEPDWLPDGSSSVGSMVIPHRRWRHQCADGTLRFHGNLSPDMQVNVILFE